MPQTGTLAMWIVVVGALAMVVLLALLPAAGHDQLWFLLMAQRWLNGALLYGPQAFDSNTPAIVWLSAGPVLLAEHLHLPLQFVAKSFVLFLMAIIGALALHLLRRICPTFTLTQTLFLSFAFILLTGVIPARDFGQRDHLSALLLIPYLLSIAAQIALTPGQLTVLLRILLAALAGVGICLKPQQALVPLVIELASFFDFPSASLFPKPRRTPLYRPETLTFLVIGAFFLYAIRRLTPLYFSRALPITLSTYWAIGHLNWFQLLVEAIQLHLLAVLSIAGLWFTHRRAVLSSSPIGNRCSIVFVLAGVAATIAYYIQGTGWYYQQLPALTFFGLALAFELLFLSDTVPIPTPPWLPAAAALLFTLTLALTFHFSGYPFTRTAFDQEHAYQIATPDPAFFDHLAPGTPIATLTTSVDDAIMPVFRYRLTWAQRTNNLWTLPAILRNESGPVPRHRIPAERLAELDALQHRFMVEDLERWRPGMILVERCQDAAVHCQVLEDRHDDLLAFFLRDPAFRQVFARYRFWRASGEYDAYVLSVSR